MTGGGAPGAAGILKCLAAEKNYKVTVADANPEVVGKYLSKNFEVIPVGDDPGFIEKVLAVCKKNKIDIILPLVTRELLSFSGNNSLFEKQGIKVLVSPAESIEIANNKSSLYEFLQWRGIAVPEFRIVETPDQFLIAVKELGYPHNPVCFKPSVSNGSRGFRILDNKIDETDILFNQKPGAAYINYDEAVRILSVKEFPQLLVSEYLTGDEYSVDCLANKGEMIIAVPRLRKKTINGISVAGTFVNNRPIIDYCRQIINELKLHGNIGIQVKASGKNEFLLLEINPRVQGTISAGLGAGINLPVLAIKQELGEPISVNELNVKWGTEFYRYWEDLFNPA
ncbi:MAG TPA: ATP-grasp domain-containing protein [Chitinophagaceae bacterium]|nr:ATP-grasp domain-containing protein [Chitinophagaceae bacterium]MCB9055603.1 ATP-grasp domain-containing protein [Chitinophagales bacterium]HPG11008.1 ATP-grasp domain-containing protein [Chitinophagaceae bacterium]HRX93286.1 ATP-grasp domain-containing protein [Chitinophagaceae bacterium]